jgi:L-ascorbate metabolism protein UlaG (beta-lactamase superfamily)
VTRRQTYSSNRTAIPQCHSLRPHGTMAYDRSVARPFPSAHVYYIGHGTVRIDLAGVRLLTDPLLRSRVLHLRRTGKVPTDAVRGVDAVLISHLHYDHLDFPSLQRLGREMPVVAPRGAGALIRRKGAATNVIELTEGEEIQIGSVTVRATHADHDTGRLPFGVQAQPVGYMIEGDGRSVYFAGDTDVFDAMSALAPVDVALLPIWGWGPSIGPGHMDSRRAAQAAVLLQARLAIPIHWGTYYPVHLGLQGRPSFLDAPAVLFEQEMLEQAPGTAVRVLRPGETTPM